MMSVSDVVEAGETETCVEILIYDNDIRSDNKEFSVAIALAEDSPIAVEPGSPTIVSITDDESLTDKGKF